MTIGGVLKIRHATLTWQNDHRFRVLDSHRYTAYVRFNVAARSFLMYINVTRFCRIHQLPSYNIAGLPR